MSEAPHERQIAAVPWHTEVSKVIVVLPAYNEAEAIQSLLMRIDLAMRDSSQSYRIILVDDGSTDATIGLAQEYAKFLPLDILCHEQNKGLGTTIRDGLAEAARQCGDRDIIVAMDADNTHTPGLITRMVRQVREGSDLVIASRYQPGSRVKGLSLHRTLLSYAASWLFRITFPIEGVRDYTCSFRAYRGAVLKEAFARYGADFISRTGFESMVDILLKLRSLDLVVTEVPMVLRYDQKGNLSKMKVGNTILSTLALIVERRLKG